MPPYPYALSPRQAELLKSFPLDRGCSIELENCGLADSTVARLRSAVEHLRQICREFLPDMQEKCGGPYVFEFIWRHHGTPACTAVSRASGPTASQGEGVDA